MEYTEGFYGIVQKSLSVLRPSKTNEWFGYSNLGTK